MKKSQILAAIALAFALGVVAPVASTHAAVIDANATVAADATTALNAAIAAGKTAGGYQGNSAYYDLYTNVRGVMQTQDAAILSVKNVQRDALNAAVVSLGAAATADAKTYEAAVANVQALNEQFAAEILNPTTQEDRKTALEAILSGLQGQLTAAANAIETQENTSARDLATAIAYLDADYDATGKTYAQVVADAKALPKYNEYAALYAAVAEGEKVVAAGTRHSVTDANNAAAAIEAAIAAVNGSTVTPGVATRTLTALDGAVIVTAKVPEGTILVVTPANDQVAAFGNRKKVMYDISLQDGKGNNVAFEGNAIVSIRTTGLDGAKSEVFHVSDDFKTTDKIDSTFANGYVTFTVAHFSKYAVVEAAAGSTTPTTPGTEDGKGDGNTTTDKNGLPNTGVVAEGADASAKSSVSIMAGVSSFITAAGSAIVAIRRGKRA